MTGRSAFTCACLTTALLALAPPTASAAAAVVADSVTQAPGLYLQRTPQSPAQRLTHLNSRFAAYAYPRSVEVQWRAPDGQPNDGILTYPEGYQPDKTRTSGAVLSGDRPVGGDATRLALV